MRPLVVRVLPELDYGGVESLVLAQAEAHDYAHSDLTLVACSKAGFAAEQIRHSKARLVLLNVDAGVRNLSCTLRLARLFRELRPAVVHASLSCVIHAALATAGLPLALITEENGVPARRTRRGRLLFSLAHRRASAIVTPSSLSSRYLQEREFVPAARIRVVHPPVERRFLDSDEVRNHHLEGGRAQILAASRLVPEKRIDLLIRALAIVRERIPETRLIIAGDGPERGALINLADQLSVAPSVVFLGAVADIAPLLRASDLFVQPSELEGFGIAIAEAAAMGVTPVFSAGCGVIDLFGSNPELLVEGPDPGAWAAAILRLLREDAGVRTDRSAYLRELVRERCRPEAFATRLVELYDELL